MRTATTFTRNLAEAERLVASANRRAGEVDRFGRIEDTLLGAELATLYSSETGRPMYRVTYRVHNFDPAVDAGLPVAVREARARFLGTR